MPGPTFIFREYSFNASAHSDSSDASSDPNDILFATEDTFHKFADNTDGNFIEIDREDSSAFDIVGILGGNMDGMVVGLSSSSDDFVTTNLIVDTNELDDPDFTDAGTSAFPWEQASASIWTFPSSGGAAINGTQVAEDKLTQSNKLTSGKWYICQVIVSGTPSSNGDLFIECGTNRGTAISTDGTFTQTILANGTSFSIVADAASSADFSGTVTLVALAEMHTVTSDVNAGAFKLTEITPDRYVRVFFANYASNMRVAFISLDSFVENPQFHAENDFGEFNVDPTGKQFISAAGLYIGSNVQYVLQDFIFKWPDKLIIDEAEDITNILNFVDHAVEDLSPFFFLPDNTDDTRVFFCWVSDRVRFTVPVKGNNRREFSSIPVTARKA